MIVVMVNRHKKYMNRREVAEYLMVSQAKVTKMVQDGLLEAEIINYNYKFKRLEVDKFRNKIIKVLKL
tara:strand:- start:5474 stop:5677 length:204 start_codon:yes stop_codon:yes gene_type:complete